MPKWNRYLIGLLLMMIENGIRVDLGFSYSKSCNVSNLFLYVQGLSALAGNGAVHHTLLTTNSEINVCIPYVWKTSLLTRHSNMPNANGLFFLQIALITLVYFRSHSKTSVHICSLFASALGLKTSP